MRTTPLPLSPERTLAELATTQAGASRVFHRHGLDFCCGGQARLDDACADAGLDPLQVIEELRAETTRPGVHVEWNARTQDQVIDHILAHYHEPHREELPRLAAMARKVESVHRDKHGCPHGLADLLAAMGEELELHMQKEEQVLFPMLRSGRGRMATLPIQVMENEHRDHGRNLERLRELTHGYDAPTEACGTWVALYLGLHELERDLMEHIHIENNILFPRALRA